MNEKPNNPKRKQPRRVYEKPTLVKYGDLGRVTQSQVSGTGRLDGDVLPPLQLKTG